MAINYTETAKEKLAFERGDQSQGLVLKGYHTDNCISDDSEFMGGLLKKQQNISLVGLVPHIKIGQ